MIRMRDDHAFRIRQNLTAARARAICAGTVVALVPLTLLAAGLFGASLGFMVIAMPVFGIATAYLSTRLGHRVLPLLEGRIARWQLRLDTEGAVYDDGEDVVRVGWAGYRFITTDDDLGAGAHDGRIGALCFVRAGTGVAPSLSDTIRRRIRSQPLRVSTVGGVTIFPLGHSDADPETILAAARDLHASAVAPRTHTVARHTAEAAA